VVAEPESSALERTLRGTERRLTSTLAKVEVRRAVLRGAPAAHAFERAEAILRRLAYVTFDDDIARVAGTLKLPLLRTADAIHLASALALGADLAGFVTYDRRLGDAATAAKLAVLEPA
jgi:predicted nucleic acid-binding protein